MNIIRVDRKQKGMILMEFKKDYSYLYLTKNEYTEPFINEVVKSIRFYGTDKFEEEYTEIKEWLEENFIMYQYKNNGIECIDIIIFILGKTGVKFFCLGNVVKYIFRYPKKNGIEDLKKARWYLNKLIELEEEAD